VQPSASTCPFPANHPAEGNYRSPMTAHYEADEAILRVEAPRLRRDVVSPSTEPATTEEPAPDEVPEAGRSVSVELTADGARIHLAR
jgi:hypothetical protein